jgi:hypothetical protein
MQISKAAIGFILAAGIAAGAGGAYFAGRSTTPPDMSAADGTGGALAPDDSLVRDGVVENAPSAPDTVDAAPAPRAASEAAPRPPRETPPAPGAAPAPRADTPSPLAEDRPAPIAPAEAPVVAEIAPAPAPEPAGPELIELVVSADSVIGLQLDTTITTERARVEDPVEAHVARDVRIGDRVAIPAGSRVFGEVTLVERGGRLKERARLGVRFTSVSLPGGTRLAIQTEPIYREGDSQAASSSTKIGGGAIGGAIIGGILGGAKGAAIGGSVGAGAGTAAVMAGARNQATLQSGAAVTVRVEQPIVITVER